MNKRDLIFVGKFKIINEKKKTKSSMGVIPPLIAQKKVYPKKKTVVRIDKSFS